MSDYHIGEAAAALGITTRTLRHWDGIGLLVPQWRSFGDYRIYTDEDIDRALHILPYREAGIPLSVIAELLADASPSARRQQLLAQRTLLRDKAARLARMIESVTTPIEEGPMSTENKINMFGTNWQDFEDEARKRWSSSA